MRRSHLLCHNFLPISCCLAAAAFVLIRRQRSRLRQSPHVTIDANVTIVESAQEPAPVHRATQDLLGDFTKVFGSAPKLVNQIDRERPVSIAHRANPPTSRRAPTAPPPPIARAFAFSIATPAGPTHARRLPDRRRHARHHLRHLPVLASRSRRRPHVSLDRQAAGEARLHHAARRLRPHLSQARSSNIAASFPTTKTCSPAGWSQTRAIRPASRSRSGTTSSRPPCA